MMVKFVMFFATIAFASAYPAIPSDTELIDPKFNDQPIIDTGVVSTGGFFDSPFDLFQGMESMMRRMREQMNAFLNRFGSSGNGTNITDIGDLPGFGFPSIPDLDLGKGNTTSVTKIINGQKVIINETSYEKGNENGGAFFKVRVIEVKPDQDQEGAITTSSSRDVESVENSNENEITKKGDNEARYGNIEALDDIDNFFPRKYAPAYNNWLSDDFDNNRIDSQLVQTMKPIDLSRDTHVNSLIPLNAPLNPDAEFIGAQAQMVGPRNPAKLMNIPNYSVNSRQPSKLIDMRTSRVNPGHDLSGDIWVNQLMSGRSSNPDAEFIPMNMNRYTPSFNRFDNGDFEADNRIDGPLVQPFKPIDMSRDIYVNSIMPKNTPINPDAELIDFKYHPENMFQSNLVRNQDAEITQANPKDFEKFINPR